VLFDVLGLQRCVLRRESSKACLSTSSRRCVTHCGPQPCQGATRAERWYHLQIVVQKPSHRRACVIDSRAMAVHYSKISDGDPAILLEADITTAYADSGQNNTSSIPDDGTIIKECRRPRRAGYRIGVGILLTWRRDCLSHGNCCNNRHSESLSKYLLLSVHILACRWAWCL
jgi:hypothetical protein